MSDERDPADTVFAIDDYEFTVYADGSGVGVENTDSQSFVSVDRDALPQLVQAALRAMAIKPT